jgi:hypothetical protein
LGLLKPGRGLHGFALLLRTQIRRETTPLEIALDTIIDHIASLTSRA